MRKNRAVITVTIIALIAGSIITAPYTASKIQEAKDEKPTVSAITSAGIQIEDVKSEEISSGQITTTGIGLVQAKLDISGTTISVEDSVIDATTGTEKHSEKVQQLVSDLVSSGINKEDISISEIYMTPNFSLVEKTGDSKTGELPTAVYILKTLVSVTASEMNTATTISNATKKINGCTVLGVEYGSTKYTEAYNAAIIVAVSNATEKAEMLSDNAELEVVSITELKGSDVSPDLVKQSSTQVSLNTQEVSAAVTVTFKVVNANGK